MERLFRSTSVPIAERPVPIDHDRPPPVPPGLPPRSSALGGAFARSRRSALTCPCGLFWVRARGTRSARPVRKQAANSRLRAPRPSIEQRLPIDFPDDESMRISHEAIYQALFIEGRGALKTRVGRLACELAGRCGFHGPGPRTSRRDDAKRRRR